MLNEIRLIGRITRDPELHTTGSGVSVMSFSVAVDRRFKQGDEKVTDFIECVAWRHNAEFLAKYGAKGRLVYVGGSLQSRKWQDKDGNNRVSWEVQTDNVILLDRPKDGANAGGGTSYTQTGTGGYGGDRSGFDALTSAAKSAGVPAFDPGVADDDDVPF